MPQHDYEENARHQSTATRAENIRNTNRSQHADRNMAHNGKLATSIDCNKAPKNTFSSFEGKTLVAAVEYDFRALCPTAPAGGPKTVWIFIFHLKPKPAKNTGLRSSFRGPNANFYIHVGRQIFFYNSMILNISNVLFYSQTTTPPLRKLIMITWPG